MSPGVTTAESGDAAQQIGALKIRRSKIRGTPERRNRPARIALIGALISLLTALIVLTAVDLAVHRIVLGDLRNYLARTALATAALIDGEEFRLFTRPEQDTTEEYRKLTRPLRVLLETNPDIHFAYSGVTQGSRMHFVLDGTPLDERDSRGVSQHAAPMQEDTASPGEIEVTRTHRVTVEAAPSATAWGMGIRAQAPIFAHDGQMVGYVGLTMRADRYAQLVHRTDLAAALGAAVAGCLAVITGLGILRTQRARETAERARTLLAERLRQDRDRLYSYAQALDQADAETRRTTAQYLHENVGQTLAGLSMMLGSARSSAAQESVKAVIINAEEATAEAQSGIRTVIQDLWPPELEQASLAQIMTWVAALFDSRYAFKVVWKIDGEAVLSPEQLMLTYRMVRELIYNIYQHSRGGEADVKIHLTARNIEFQVMDKGVTSDAFHWVQRLPETFGLTRVRERMHAAGGKFELIDLPGGGLWATVMIPI